MNGLGRTRCVQVPPGRAVLRRRRGAPPAPDRGGGGLASSRAGTTRRSSRRSSTTPTSSPRRRLRRKTYSFVGRDGSLLALRPDFTSLLAKIAAGRLAAPPGAASASTTRARCCATSRRRPAARASCTRWASSTWAATRRAADAEIARIAAECLEALGGAAGCWRSATSACSRGLVDAARPRAGGAGAAARARGGKDAPASRDALAGARRARARWPRRWRGSPRSAGDAVRARARPRARFAFCAPARAAPSRELRAHVLRRCGARGSGAHLAVDLGEVRGLDYYTGLVFRVYAPGLGFEVGGGGRYDALLARFGRPMPAVGFMLGLDRVALLLERQGRARRRRRRAGGAGRGRDLGAALAEARAPPRARARACGSETEAP